MNPLHSTRAHRPLLRRMTLALTVCLSAASLVAFAAEPAAARETTDIELTANGRLEKISIEDLKVGETRQIYSEAGTLVTATRLADSLQLDVGGEKKSVPMPDHAGRFDDAELAALIEKAAGDASADADGKKPVHIRRISLSGEEGEGEGKKQFVIVTNDKDEHSLADDHDVVVRDAGEGERIVVKRRIVKAEPQGEAK